MKELKAITVLLAIMVVFVIGVVLYLLSSVLLPFVIALLLSFIFKPVMLWLTHRRVPTGIALLGVLLLVAGVLFLLTLIIVPSVESFIEQFPKYQDRLTTLIAQMAGFATSIAGRFGADTSTFNPADAIKLSTVTTVATAGLVGFLSSISNAFLVLLFLLFLLAGSGELTNKVGHAFSEQGSEQIAGMIRNIDRQVRQYLIMKTVINIGHGLFTALLLLAFGVDFAIFWGLVAFLLNFIPNIGSVISTIFPVLIALVQFDTPTRPLIALVLLIVGNNLIGNVLEPKLMQFSLNLSPVLILVMLIFWGWLWGIWGMILAVPITSTLKIICENVEQLRPLAILMSGKVEVAEVG
jgi:predicted PurR-regulated permease PerM